MEMCLVPYGKGRAHACSTREEEMENPAGIHGTFMVMPAGQACLPTLFISVYLIGKFGIDCHEEIVLVCETCEAKTGWTTWNRNMMCWRSLVGRWCHWRTVRRFMCTLIITTHEDCQRQKSLLGWSCFWERLILTSGGICFCPALTLRRPRNLTYTHRTDLIKKKSAYCSCDRAVTSDEVAQHKESRRSIQRLRLCVLSGIMLCWLYVQSAIAQHSSFNTHYHSCLSRFHQTVTRSSSAL
nr:hypothetical protein CFP56_20441 [Quercus suber]